DDHAERRQVPPVDPVPLRRPPRAWGSPLGVAGHRSMVPTLGVPSSATPVATNPSSCENPEMRFGIKTSPQNTTWADMLAVWQAADDIDVYESGWTFDHFYPIFSDSTGPCLEGWTTLTALAQATSRLRLGTLVTGIHYRHPAVLANMVAAL